MPWPVAIPIDTMSMMCSLEEGGHPVGQPIRTWRAVVSPSRLCTEGRCVFDIGF